MTMKSIPKIVCTIAVMSASFIGSAHAKTEAATPWGIEIGGACQQGLDKMGATKQKSLDDGDTMYYAVDNNMLYQGAKEVSLRCSNGKVIALQVLASKEGMGNPAARAAYQTLAKRYKKVAGGPVPQLGNGYARFVKGTSVIEIEARHLDFDFTVTYLTKGFYDDIVETNKKRAQDKLTNRAGM